MLAQMPFCGQPWIQKAKAGGWMEREVEAKLLLTIPEVARCLGLGRSFTYALILHGELPSIKLGRSRRVPVAALERFIATKLSEQAEDPG